MSFICKSCGVAQEAGTKPVKVVVETRNVYYPPIKDDNGKLIKKETIKEVKNGENILHKNIKKLKAGYTYWVTLKTQTTEATQKLIIEPE